MHQFGDPFDGVDNGRATTDADDRVVLDYDRLRLVINSSGSPGSANFPGSPNSQARRIHNSAVSGNANGNANSKNLTNCEISQSLLTRRTKAFRVSQIPGTPQAILKSFQIPSGSRRQLDVLPCVWRLQSLTYQ